MKFSVSVLTLTLFAATASAQQAPRVFLTDPAVLAAQKAHPDPAFLKMAVAGADSALKRKPVSVMEKAKTPPSGDKHDYTSLSRYFWPNPSTPNHLPYVRHDGESNPEIKLTPDHDNLVHMAQASYSLALGYYLTGNEKYAAHAALMLRTWFLDPATMMNPNMNFAQYVPGQYDGRGSGILDARWFTQAIDAIGMLQGSKSWSADDTSNTKAWFSRYYTWLNTSANGKHEHDAPNNHGSWFATQTASIASFVGRTDDVRAIAERVRDQRIPSQFDEAGMQKYELVRTNSFSYSAFNLEALTALAQIVAPTGIDLYTPAKAGQPGILTGLDALLPFDPQHPWPHQQIGKDMEGSICPPLFRAAAHTHQAKYKEAESRFGCEPDLIEMQVALGNR